MSETTYEMKPGQFQLFMVSPETKAKSKNPDSYPDYTGKIKLTDEIIAAIRAGEDPTLRIAGWGKRSQNGTIFVAGSVSIDKPREAQVTQQEAAGFMVTPTLAAAGVGPLDTPDDNPPASAKEVIQQRKAAQPAEVDSDLPF